MWTFTATEYNCRVERSDDDWRHIYLESSKFEDKRVDGRVIYQGSFVLTDTNVKRLFEEYKPSDYYVWKLSFMEAVRDYIQRKTDRLTAMQLLSTLTIDKAAKLPPILKSINGNPEPFANQKIGQYWNNYIEDHAFLWEMGTGKTRSAIEGFVIKQKKKLVRHAMVVCPVSMIDKWVAEIAKWSGNISAIGLQGPRKDKEQFLKENWDWYVVSFETLTGMIDDFLEIIDDKWYVVLDEFTKIKNPDAKRAKACVQIGMRTKHKCVLSGTPITQHAYDIFTPYLFLDGGKTFGTKYDDFIDKYFYKMGYKKEAKYGALEEISNKMYTSATRFLKKECIDIPDKVYDHRYLELPAENRQKYDQMVAFCQTAIEGSEIVTAFVILTQLLRLSQITSGFVKDVAGNEVTFQENPKIDALKDILEESNGASIVVWARFKWDCHLIAKLCDELKITYTTLTGETKANERTQNIADFQSGKAKVIIGTAGTGGHGVDLTAASIVVYYSNSYSLEQRLQSEDRAHRAGQRNQVTYIDLLCKKTVDVAIYKILRDKKNIADIVTRDSFRDLI